MPRISGIVTSRHVTSRLPHEQTTLHVPSYLSPQHTTSPFNQVKRARLQKKLFFSLSSYDNIPNFIPSRTLLIPKHIPNCIYLIYLTLSIPNYLHLSIWLVTFNKLSLSRLIDIHRNTTPYTHHHTDAYTHTFLDSLSIYGTYKSLRDTVILYWVTSPTSKPTNHHPKTDRLTIPSSTEPMNNVAPIPVLTPAQHM